MLRGRCACGTVVFELADEFVRAFNCHCSNCRALTGSAYLPWGEIERRKLRLTVDRDTLLVTEEGDAQMVNCGTCYSLLYWTSRGGSHLRVPYGTLVDEPTLKPSAHMFVASKAPWHEIADDLPQHSEYPW